MTATSSSRIVDKYSKFEIKKKRKIAVISECLERNDVDEEVKKSIGANHRQSTKRRS